MPYIIVPLNEKNPNIPFYQPNELQEIPFSPIIALPQHETHGKIKISQRIPKEIEKYEKKQAQKPKSPLRPKEKKKIESLVCTSL